MFGSIDRRLLLTLMGVLGAKEAVAAPVASLDEVQQSGFEGVATLEAEDADVVSSQALRQPLLPVKQEEPELTGSEWSSNAVTTPEEGKDWEADISVVPTERNEPLLAAPVMTEVVGEVAEIAEAVSPVDSEFLIVVESGVAWEQEAGAAEPTIEDLADTQEVTAESEVLLEVTDGRSVLAPRPLAIKLPQVAPHAATDSADEAAPGIAGAAIAESVIPERVLSSPVTNGFPMSEAAVLEIGQEMGGASPWQEGESVEPEQAVHGTTSSEITGLETIGFDIAEDERWLNRLQPQSLVNGAGDLEELGLGLDWQVAPGVTAGASQRFYTAGSLEGTALSTLEVKGEQAIAPNTKLTARYVVGHALGGEAKAGLLQQQALGLKHRWQLMPKMFVDFNYERVWGRGLGLAELEQKPLTPLGLDDEIRYDELASAAEPPRLAQALRWPDSLTQMSKNRVANRAGNRVGLDLNYLPGPNWEMQGRLQNRSEGDRSRTQVTAALRSQLSPSWSSSLDGEQTFATDPKVDGMGPTTHLRLGLAYRSTAKQTASEAVAELRSGLGDEAISPWAMRLRYEYRRNLDLSSDGDVAVSDEGFGSATHLAAAELSYKPAQRWQLRSQLALRHRALHWAEEPEDEGMAALAQLRGSYRLSPRFKLRGDVRSRYQLSGQGSQTGVALEAAYGVTRYLNLVVGYGLGKGRDRDFLKRGFTNGPYVRLKFK